MTLRTHALALGFLSLVLHRTAVAAQSVRIEGSSAGLTISQAAAAEFRRSNARVPVSVGLSGSGGAFAKLCRGEADLVHSARPMLKAEIEACQKADVLFIELAIAMDAVTVVVNPKNSFVRSLTLPELRAMWQESAQGKVVRWSQVNASYPDAPLKLLAPDAQFDGSNYFLAAVLEPGESARRDYMGSVDDNVLIQGVMRDLNTVSYLPVATYLENRGKLRAVPIAASARTEAVAPSLENIEAGRYRPLSRPIFLYVDAASLARPEVATFAQLYAANAATLAQGAGYVPLSQAAYRAGQDRLSRRVTGSVWHGVIPVGLGVAELQKREAM